MISNLEMLNSPKQIRHQRKCARGNAKIDDLTLRLENTKRKEHKANKN
jgi:hypothetical protein